MKRTSRDLAVVLIVFVFAAVHFLATLFSLLSVMYGALGAKMPNWLGNPGVMLDVLGFPANLIIGFMGGLLALPFALGLGFYAANSFLWGASLAALTGWLVKHRKSVNPSSVG